MSDMHLVPVETCRAQITAVLTAWGMAPETVRVTAEVMIETDLAGVDSHGISMLMDYDESRRKGRLNLQAQPRILRQNPVTALVDADAGLGHPAAVFGMKLAMEKAKVAGVGVVAVRNSHHFGAAGSYAALARIPGAVDVDVLAEHPDGRRTVVSHFNKSPKGRIVRALLEDGAKPRTPARLAADLTRLGWTVEIGPATAKGTQLDVVVSEI